jgi:hypothetical protein
MGKDLTGHRIVDGGALSNFAIRLTVSDSPEVQRVMDPAAPADEAFTIGFMLDSHLEVPNAPDTVVADPEGILAHIWEWSMRAVAEMRNPNNLPVVLSETLNTMMTASDNFMIGVNEEHICRLPVKGFGTLEFGMPEERRVALVSAAQNTTQQFLEGVPTAVLSDLTLQVGENGMFEITFSMNGEPGNRDWIGLFPSSDAGEGDYTDGNWIHVNDVKEGHFVTATKAELGPFVARYYRNTSWLPRRYQLISETASFQKAVAS